MNKKTEILLLTLMRLDKEHNDGKSLPEINELYSECSQESPVNRERIELLLKKIQDKLPNRENK